MTIDLGVAYGAARVRICDLVSPAGADGHMVVPASPAWTVQNVMAHISGIAADATSGNMAGAPGEEWTAAQVARSEGKSVPDLIAEWEQSGPLLEAFLSAPGGELASAAVIDIHTHEADLRHALGAPASVPADFLQWAAATLRDGFVAAVAEAGLAPVEVAANDFDWFRGRLGRRTVDEVRAFTWSLDPAPYLDSFFIFGRRDVPLGEGGASENRE